MGIGVYKDRKNRWFDKKGNRLPGDNLSNVVKLEDTIISKSGRHKRLPTISITNPNVARDTKHKSYTFGGMTRTAAKRLTNKKFKNRVKIIEV